MKKALISPNEKVYDYEDTLIGERIAEVTGSPFDVAPPLFWVDCADEVTAEWYYWSGSEFLTIPIPPEPPLANTANTSNV